MEEEEPLPPRASYSREQWCAVPETSKTCDHAPLGYFRRRVIRQVPARLHFLFCEMDKNAFLVSILLPAQCPAHHQPAPEVRPLAHQELSTPWGSHSQLLEAGRITHPRHPQDPHGCRPPHRSRGPYLSCFPAGPSPAPPPPTCCQRKAPSEAHFDSDHSAVVECLLATSPTSPVGRSHI